ncbi:MAG: FAD-binding protein [Candidatus Accumulibacter sp.]|jgi:electron transfer flavoprotein alpha subunit|nr:FAD-binding protein [Accumulibacter sp.]
MKCLVVAEHDDSMLDAATAHAVTAARKITDDVCVLVAGSGCGNVAREAARIAGVAGVLLADSAQYADQSPEPVAELVTGLMARYSHCLAAATSKGKSLMPRVAALLDVAQISDIVAVESDDTFVRPIYAGNALVTVRSSDAVKVVTVRTTAFDAAATNASPEAEAPVEAIAIPDARRKSKVLSRELTQSVRPGLDAAKVVVAGGRGLASAENFRQIIEPLADRLGAAIGATRAAVDAGFVSNDLQVGQTGKIVAPRLYIAIGLSGAIQHVAGMKDSEIIVAINKDPEAPIFHVADFGLVADLFETVPALTAALDITGET